MTATAIETHYAGHRFRSRLEARWAVFFDALGVKWQYEPQGYLVGFAFPEEGVNRKPYLPDFHLPETQTWVEVKGSPAGIDWQLLADAVDWGNGLPGTADSCHSDRGLLLLGSIPADGPHRVEHAILQHQKGGSVASAWFGDDGLHVSSPNDLYFDSSWGSQTGACAVPWVTYCTERLGGTFTWRSRVRGARVRAAYDKARKARFEHGESG